MRNTLQGFRQRFRFVIAPLTLALATQGFAADLAGPTPLTQPKLVVSDISLTTEDGLMGQVVNAQGKPLANSVVRLHDGENEPVEGATNDRGQFAYRDVPAGVYYLQAGNQVRIIRAWPHKIAPPTAQQGVLLVSSTEAVRGQYCPPSGVDGFVQKSKRLLTNPFVVAGIIATAVAIPVAIHNADDGS